MKIIPAAAAALLLVTVPAFAHAHLAASDPTDGATVPAPAALTLTFTEGVEPAFSGATVTGPAGAVATKPVAPGPAGAQVLVVPFDAPLPAGAYTVAWHALAADGHKSEGTFAFTVE